MFLHNDQESIRLRWMIAGKLAQYNALRARYARLAVA